MGNQSVTQNNLLQYLLPSYIILLPVVNLRRKIPVTNGKELRSSTKHVQNMDCNVPVKDTGKENLRRELL
jgi:hypothetical protein